MLKQMLKYDLKSLSRFLIPLHILALIMTIIMRISLGNDPFAKEPSTLLIIEIIMFIIILVLVPLASYLVIGIHFYQSLFSAHGYLTWTLPLSAKGQLLSKLITAFWWALIDLLTLITSIIIFLSSTGFNWDKFARSFSQEITISFDFFIACIVVLSVIGIFVAVLYVFVSIAIGQLFSSHRLLAAVIIYGTISVVLQLLELPLSFSGSIFDATTKGYSTFFIIVGLFYIITGVIAYLVTYYIMKKKINLT